MPSCNTRRMAETAAHLSDHVYPHLPVRQWVLSVPKRLRYFMRRDGAVLNIVLRIFLRVITQSLSAHCPGAANVDRAVLHIGAVAFIHRFDSSLNEHVHFHVCVVDGVFEDLAGGVLFHPQPLELNLVLWPTCKPPCAAAFCAHSSAGVYWRVSRAKRCWPANTAVSQSMRLCALRHTTEPRWSDC